MPFSLSNFRYLPRSLANGAQNLYNGNTVNPREQSAEKGMKYGFFSAKNREKDVAFFERYRHRPRHGNRAGLCKGQGRCT